MENEKRPQEQTEQKQEPEKNTPQGWKDVVITPEMPLVAIVQFLNILNQRLCTIEDNLLVEMPTGEKLTISEIYRIQAEAEMNARQQEQSVATKEKGE